LAEPGVPYISSFSIHGVVTDLEYAECRVVQVRTFNSFFRLKAIECLVAAIVAEPINGTVRQLQILCQQAMGFPLADLPQFLCAVPNVRSQE
jgi:hypothetical protein